MSKDNKSSRTLAARLSKRNTNQARVGSKPHLQTKPDKNVRRHRVDRLVLSTSYRRRLQVLNERVGRTPSCDSTFTPTFRLFEQHSSGMSDERIPNSRSLLST
jgi:hypothetical protein